MYSAFEPAIGCRRFEVHALGFAPLTATEQSATQWASFLLTSVYDIPCRFRVFLNIQSLLMSSDPQEVFLGVSDSDSLMGCMDPQLPFQVQLSSHVTGHKFSRLFPTVHRDAVAQRSVCFFDLLCIFDCFHMFPPL